MTNLNTTVNSAAPLWAAFGAPLVGAPIMMVALLALGPQTGVESTVEPEVGYVVEQVELPEVDVVVEASR